MVGMRANSLAPESSHPYYPLESLILDYAPNKWAVRDLLLTFMGGLFTVSWIAYTISRRARSSIQASEVLTVLWFVLCGCLHVFFEGYYIVNFERMPSRQTFFGQLWKEYSLSDSRYMIPNSFVFCVEAITVIIWGPLSFLTAVMVIVNHPLRHPFQAMVSLAHLQGNALYYATSIFDFYYWGISHSRPEPFYYWGYYVFANSFWIVIPLVLLYQSVTASGRALRLLDRASRLLQADGAAKRHL